MEIGDKIKTIYGNVETVMNIEDARITTFESVCQNSWYHPTKVFPVYWSEKLQCMLVCRRIELETIEQRKDSALMIHI